VAIRLNGKIFWLTPEMFAACIINALSYKTSVHTVMV
jgi:hypothetical protein